jgi:lysylphosphatidylglycerol synthetase-like protein (DUF2156 family)
MSLSKPQPKGYLAAALGGVSGAVLMFVLSLLFSRMTLTSILEANPGPTIAIITLLASASFGEVMGCFVALRLGRYTEARKTALWLVVLLIPGFLFFLFARLLIGAALAAGLCAIALPLIARALTRHPNYPSVVQRVVHTYAKRPPSF